MNTKEELSWRERVFELFRFAAAGLATNGVYFLALALFLWWSVPVVASAAIAYTLSLAASYYLQSRFTFRARTDRAAVLGRYLVAHAIGMGINSVVLHLTVSFLRLHLVLGQGLALVLVMLWTYVAMKFWVFRKVAG